MDFGGRYFDELPNVLQSINEHVNFQSPFFLTAILGIVGYAEATNLGLWLIISILRSGKL